MRRYGLTWALLALAALCLAASTLGGWREYEAQQVLHGEAATLADYAGSLWALHAIGGLWDEFAFGAAFTVLAAKLIHEGSPESRDGSDRVEETLGRIESRLTAMDARCAGREDWP